MKQIKRSIAALLAAVLVFSLIPVMASAQEEAPKTVRSSVMLGASGLVNGDTLVLGYAKPDAAVREYPLEWQVLDAQKDSQGRTGGKLLISKYLLPAVEETENGNLNMDALSGIFMPESYAVLPTTLSDSAYVANLNENYISAYKGNVDCAGVYTQREDHALTAASFFALSAEEMEYYFKNSDGKLSMSSENDLLRRPYAAGYAMTDGGSRSWALRSLTKTGKTAAVVPATDDDKYTVQTGGLIAAAGEDTLSRPAFNLRSNAITFVYQTDIDPDPIAMAGTVAPSETRPQIVDAHISPTGTVSGVGEWRAALHALPTLQLQARFCNDGSYILTPPAGHSYMIGVLETDADGNVLNWGIARRNDFGIFSFTPDEGVTDLYFYSFEYDTVSGQLYTSNLVHVGDGAAKAMTLGAGHLQNGDSVFFSDLKMSVVNADNASTALASPDSNITKTAINDEYPMQNDDAVFMAAKLPGYSMTYKHSSFDLSKAQDDYFDLVYEYHTLPSASSLLRSEYERIAHEASSAVAAANTANQKAMPLFDAIMPEQLEIHYKFMDSVAFTWTNDELTAVSGPTSYAYQQEESDAVNGSHFFLLSAKEYLSADAKTKAFLGTTLLRSHIQENFSMTMQPQIETVSYPSAASGNSVITVNNSADVSDVGAALGFNLRRDHIVFMYQKDDVNQGTVSASDLPDVPAYDENNDNWVLALLDPELSLTKSEYAESPSQNPGIGISGARWVKPGGGVSYLSLLVTDGAGNVKQYGRIANTADYPENSTIPVKLDYASFDYGDRVYVVNEHQMTYYRGDYVFASEPLLIYEQKLAGEVNFSQNDYLPGETVVTDLSKITVSGCETIKANWFANRSVEETIGSDFLWTADGTDQTVTFCTKCGLYGVKANLNAAEGVLMAYNGAHEQDDFTGDTLYYGEKGADNYAWTVIGRPTKGVAAVREKSGTEALKDPDKDNVLTLMRKDLTTLGDLNVSGYMTYGVLESDLSDPGGTVKGISFNASSEKNKLTFRPSAYDFQKLINLKLTPAIFAAAPTSDTEEAWYLRNVGTMSRSVMVDGLQQLQLKKVAAPNPTRESVNLNNKDIVFITPADKALTYSDLSGYREGSVDEWKLTVYDPDCISYRELSAKHAGNTVTVDCRVSDAMDGRYITVWAEKDGELVWLDSKPAAAADEYHETFTIPEGIEADEAFVVLRKDNGTYHSDVCTLPQSAEPTKLKIEIYVNNELTNEGCTVSTFELWSGERRDAFYLGEEVGLRASAEHGYEIIDMDVAFSDGTTDRISGNVHIPAEQLDWSFTMQTEDPVLRVYLRTGEYQIHALSRTFDQNGKEISEPENQVLAPATAHGGNMFTYKVVCKNGYYVDKIYVGDQLVPKEQTIEIAEVKDEETVYILSYAPGDYQAKMPIGSDLTIGVDFRKIPDFALTLVAIPPEGGTITASDTENIKPNTNVTVNAQPNEGWVLTKVTMYSDLYPEVELERGENGYTFEMPPAATTVEAWFEKLCPVTVEVYVNSKPADYGCSWKITDGQGTERSTFFFGEEVNFEATADEGYTIELAQLVNSSMPYLDWDEDSAFGSFPFPGEEAVIQVFLSTQMTNITIDCQTLDVDGTVMEKTAGGEVGAPTEPINYNELYFYTALANEGYYVESVTENGEPVENPDPQTMELGGKSVTIYPSGDYEAYGTTEDVSYFVTFRKLAEHTITSAFTDISTETPVPVTDASVVYTVNGEERTVFHAGDEVTASITCAENYAIDHAEALPETAMTQTGTYTFTFTMPDSDLNVTYFLKRLAIRSAFLHVDEDINLIYGVQVPEGFENPTATFRFMGRSYTTSDYTVGADGRYNFEFEDVTPQCIGEPVEIAVTATFNGTTYYSTNSGYSVRQYCVNMLGKTTDELLKTLLSDILVYGEKAQLYTGFKTDALVTDGVALCASTYPGLSGLHEQFIGTADADVYWRAASLCLSNNVSLELKFHASDIEGLAVTFKIGERTQTFTEFTPVEGEDGTYTVTYHGILATEFDVPVSASFSRNGETVGNTLKYSVNIYICNKQNSGEPLESLLHALYNYGESAKEYYCERVVK